MNIGYKIVPRVFYYYYYYYDYHNIVLYRIEYSVGNNLKLLFFFLSDQRRATPNLIELGSVIN